MDTNGKRDEAAGDAACLWHALDRALAPICEARDDLEAAGRKEVAGTLGEIVGGYRGGSRGGRGGRNGDAAGGGVANAVLSAADICHIVAFLDPGSLARLASRAASDDTSAAVGLDVGTGELAVLTWRAGSEPPLADGVVVLAWCPAHRRADAETRLRAAATVPPSAEVVEETVARAGAREGVYWPLVEVLFAGGRGAA